MNYELWFVGCSCDVILISFTGSCWKSLSLVFWVSLSHTHTGCLVNYGAALRCICFSCTSAIGRPCCYWSQHRSVVFKTSSSRYSYLNECGVCACSEARLHGLAVFYSACVSSMLVMLLETQLCWNNNQDLTLLASHQLWCACVCIHASACLSLNLSLNR